MNHLMIDLETMGNKPNAPIVAIGAVFFDPATGELGAQFSAAVTLESEMNLGATPDADTIMWWMTQSSEARAAISSGSQSIFVALHNLKIFVSENCIGHPKVWGNGASFDNVILRAAYIRIGHPPFWPFWADLDVRTVVEMGRVIGVDPKRDMPFTGERHSALADALHQAKYVSAIWHHMLAKHAEVI